MRTTILLLPIALTTLASMPVAAQDAPRVLFCTGQCTAVDEKGVRTPAPKGTQLRDNQRLETGPGGYAQVKLGRDVAMGIGESAQVRFDQKSVRGKDVVILDQGRVRMLDGAALGRPSARALELRTTNGNFALRGADIEVKTPPRSGRTDSSLTVVNLNAGDARLLTPEGTVLRTASPQGFTGGKVTTDKVSPTDVAMTTSASGLVRTVEPVRDLQRPPVPTVTTVRNDPSLSTLPLGPTYRLAPPPLIPPTLAERPVLNADTGLKTTLVEAIKTEPAVSTTTTSTSRFIVVDTSKTTTTTTRTTTPTITTRTLP